MLPPKESVAVVIRDGRGRFLAVRRADSDEVLPGVWGLPAATLRAGETTEDACRRAARDKLGVEIAVGRRIGAASNAVAHLTEYEVTILRGTPAAPQSDETVSQYAAARFTSDPGVLREAARRGSLCSQVYLREARVAWEEDAS